MGKYRRQKAGTAIRRALTSTNDIDDSLMLEAAVKAFVSGPPLIGSNAIPVTSTPTRPSIGSIAAGGVAPAAAAVGGVRDEDEEMTSNETPQGF